MKVELTLAPSPADEKAVLDGLIAFNEKAGGSIGYQPMAILLKDDAGVIQGGLVGRVVYDWLFIELLHIPESARGDGLGKRMMAQAEEFARQRGLAGLWLDTYHFQARGFYEKLGFTVFGTLEGHPIGGARFFLEKRFAPVPTATRRD
jgi:GNAT superfamily N-acetyltransferase